MKINLFIILLMFTFLIGVCSYLVIGEKNKALNVLSISTPAPRTN